MFKVKNCNFKFLCNKDWNELEETEDQKIRYCNECKNNVCLCLDEEDFLKAIRQGRCVATMSDDERFGIQQTVGMPSEKYFEEYKNKDKGGDS